MHRFKVLDVGQLEHVAGDAKSKHNKVVFAGAVMHIQKSCVYTYVKK